MLGRSLYGQIYPTSCKILKLINQNTVSSAITRSLESSNYLNIKKSFGGYRSFSEKSKLDNATVEFEYVKKATENQNVLIIDVREPDEIKEHGKIPNSINIPLGNVTPVLSTLPEKEFTKLYNRTRPSEDTEIIFYCMIGKRSGMAQQNAINLGYKNVKNYLGSYIDWANKSQKV